MDAVSNMIEKFDATFTTYSQTMIRRTSYMRHNIKEMNIENSIKCNIMYNTARMIAYFKKNNVYEAYRFFNCIKYIIKGKNDSYIKNNKKLNEYCIDKLVKMRYFIEYPCYIQAYKILLDVIDIFENRDNLYFKRGKSYMKIKKRLELIYKKFENNDFYLIHPLIDDCIISMNESYCFMDYFDDKIYTHIYSSKY